MNNQEKESLNQQNENIDYHFIKNELYSIYNLCSVDFLNNQNMTDINQMKINDIIFHIKSSINNIISCQTQFQNYIIKLESDIRHFLKREFQFNIMKNSLESKLKAYMNIEEEYQELKEKVHFSAGKFLENDKKDNEIIILKKENSSLKKDIIRYEQEKHVLEETIAKDQDTIDELKLKITKLTNLVSELKRQYFQNMRNNSSINLNIINNNNINPNKNKKNGFFFKHKNTFLNSPKSPYNLESFHSNITNSNKTKFEYKRKSNSEFTMDNDRNYNTNYNKVFNINKKNINGTKKHKSRSISMLLDDNEKKENYNWLNNSINKQFSNIKGQTINKIYSLPKYKLSISNKNESALNLRNIKDTLPKKMLKNNLNLNVKGKNSIFVKRIFQKTVK